MGYGEETIDGPEPAVTCFAIVEVAEMSVRDEGKGYLLEVPLDASGIEGFVPDREVKVLVLGEGVPARSATVQLDTQGKGSARFAFDGRPVALQVYVGPADAADDELPGLQTIAHRVAARRWTGAARLKLPVSGRRRCQLHCRLSRGRRLARPRRSRRQWRQAPSQRAPRG
jgi:hypothetical protein